MGGGSGDPPPAPKALTLSGEGVPDPLSEGSSRLGELAECTHLLRHGTGSGAAGGWRWGWGQNPCIGDRTHMLGTEMGAGGEPTGDRTHRLGTEPTHWGH